MDLLNKTNKAMTKTNKFGMNITTTPQLWIDLGKKYGVNPFEVAQIDLNWSGVHLPNHEVKEDYRVRFKATIKDGDDSWFALPVRAKEDTFFSIFDKKLNFGKIEIGKANVFNDGIETIGQTEDLFLDTCESSYQRGLSLLNLNSRSRSDCAGCNACVHHHKNLYDETVIKDNTPLNTKEDIEKFLDDKKIDVLKLNQIAVVTGLFGSEENVVKHMQLINDVVKKRGFTGELMYFGCEVNSDKALDELAKLDNFAIVYALDNFTNREKSLNKKKSVITLDKAHNTLAKAKERGIRVTISYIAGLDPIEDMKAGFNKFKDVLTSFPVINIYQVQTKKQSDGFTKEARNLEYYIQSRVILEETFKDTNLRPKRWENYRPLWYKYFGKEKLPSNSYGENEKISQYAKFGRNINVADIIKAVKNNKQRG